MPAVFAVAEIVLVSIAQEVLYMQCFLLQHVLHAHPGVKWNLHCIRFFSVDPQVVCELIPFTKEVMVYPVFVCLSFC